MRYALFFGSWFTLLGLAYWYVGRRMIHGSLLSRRATRARWILMLVWFLLPTLPLVFLLNGIQNELVDVLSWLGYLGLALFAVLILFVVARDVGLLTRRLWNLVTRKTSDLKSVQQQPEVDRQRRQFLLHSTNLSVISAATLVTGYGVYEARRRADIEQVTIPLPNLPEEFDGFKIVQFTDLHVGPTIKRGFVERVAQQVADLNGDCLVFTGDLVDGSVPWLRADVAPLRELSAPFGKFFITGNHEYYSGVLPWIEEAGRLGFDVLLNEHRILERGEGRLVMAGVTDYGAGDFVPEQKSDPFAAVRGVPDGLVRILLAHQPRSIFEADKAGVDLQISGHTHGGQFFPWTQLATLNQPYITGLHRHNNMWVYVNRGTGYWGPPIRIGVPPEITVFTLTRESGS